MGKPAQDLSRLEAIIGGYGSTAVAFSGGVDSALVALAARRRLGDGAIAVISDSPTLPRDELGQARTTAEAIGIRFRALARNELDDPRFAANTVQRCYFCKAGLQEDLMGFARREGFETVSYGVNVSDLGDWRPGVQAARERGARFPLVEAGLGKSEIRAAARAAGLPVWDKPASPCLSSRIPYGEAVTLDKLRLIDAAESFVRRSGFRDLRVRHFSGVARVEVSEADLVSLQSKGPQIRAGLLSLGFRDVILDPRGLVSGRLNVEGAGAAGAGTQGSPPSTA